ncbi:hypothetical protein J6G99_07800 [bacterium]|nr:hypothetical protein [bacterium]
MLNKIRKYFRDKALEKKVNKLKKFALSQVGETSTSKTFVGAGTSLKLSAETTKLIEQVKSNVDDIVKQTNADPEKLLSYVKSLGTSVYRIPKATQLLTQIGEEEGFITEKFGIHALWLSFITHSGLKFKTEPMMVFGDKALDKYEILYSFYKWYSMKTGLSGFDYKTRKNFKLYELNSQRKFSLNDIVNIQEAIAREKEATNYTLEYSKYTESADKIKNDGNTDI